MNQKWFLNNILESERKTGFDWFNFDLEIELLTLWIFYLIQSNFIKFTLKNILNTFLHIVTITCVFVGKLWQFLVELFVVSKWRNLWKSLSSSEVVTVFEADVGGHRCPDSVQIYCAVSVGQNQVQIRNPDTRKPSRLKISDFDWKTPHSNSRQNYHRRLMCNQFQCKTFTIIRFIIQTK